MSACLPTVCQALGNRASSRKMALCLAPAGLLHATWTAKQLKQAYEKPLQLCEKTLLHWKDLCWTLKITPSELSACLFCCTQCMCTSHLVRPQSCNKGSKQRYRELKGPHYCMTCVRASHTQHASETILVTPYAHTWTSSFNLSQTFLTHVECVVHKIL